MNFEDAFKQANKQENRKGKNKQINKTIRFRKLRENSGINSRADSPEQSCRNANRFLPKLLVDMTNYCAQNLNGLCSTPWISDTC